MTELLSNIKQIFSALRGMLSSLCRMAYILIFHRKRCENCMYLANRTLYCVETRKPTKLLDICDKWEKW